MYTIQKYYRLKSDIKLVDFRIDLIHNNSNRIFELEGAILEREKMYSDISYIELQLNEINIDSDKIRIGFISIIGEALAIFNKIKQWDIYFPFCNQGVIGVFMYLKYDLSNVLQSEAHSIGISDIHMSEEQWDFEKLESLLVELKADLLNSNFSTKMEAIIFYETMDSKINILQSSLKVKYKY
ncbi:MAG: hypothetical protein PSX81_06070 [bacterium]|nr:hypothetical protein [bacterium]